MTIEIKVKTYHSDQIEEAVSEAFDFAKKGYENFISCETIDTNDEYVFLASRVVIPNEVYEALSGIIEDGGESGDLKGTHEIGEHTVIVK